MDAKTCIEVNLALHDSIDLLLDRRRSDSLRVTLVVFIASIVLVGALTVVLELWV